MSACPPPPTPAELRGCSIHAIPENGNRTIMARLLSQPAWQFSSHLLLLIAQNDRNVKSQSGVCQSFFLRDVITYPRMTCVRRPAVRAGLFPVPEGKKRRQLPPPFTTAVRRHPKDQRLCHRTGSLTPDRESARSPAGTRLPLPESPDRSGARHPRTHRRAMGRGNPCLP